MNENILDAQDFEESNLRRRELLPIWIKAFIWFFLVFGALAPVGLIAGVLGLNFDLALYGVSTVSPLSLTGIFIITIFALKGVVAFGLWTEKYWAVNLAIIDAVIGILVCVFVMIVLPSLYSNEVNFVFRLELVFLIPYLLKMQNIQAKWVNRN